jgi:hypothetical protein
MTTRAAASPSFTSLGVSPAVPRRRAARAAAGRSPGEGRAPFARARRPSRSIGLARVDRDGTDDASGSGSAERVARAFAAFAAASTLALAPASAPALAANPAYSGVDPDASDLIKRLKARSDANKADYDAARLDNFYRRDYAINKLVGKEVLPEPCDPRDPEFGYRCGSNLPRLPMSRTDPFDDRSAPDAPRRGAVFGLNDLNVEDEPGFGVTESNTTEGTESGIENIDDETSVESEPSSEDTSAEEARNASDDVFGGAAEMNDSGVF